MEQLFLTILNRAVTAGRLVLLVMVLRVVLKKAPRAAHYGLWAIVAVRLLWPGDLLPRAGVSLVPTTEPISGDVLTAAGTAVSGGLPAVGSPAGAAAAETAARTGQSLGHIAAVVWLVGMAAMALYLAGSYVRLRVRLRTAVRLEDGVWESEQAPSPFVLGFIRPRIYLPFGLDRGSRDYVLAHERTHIRHRDHWVKPLAFLLLAVYWFNPLLWAAYILLCRDMEYACDEAVLRDLEEPDKRAYSQALLNCAGPRRAVTACPVAFGEICVKGRIRRALRYKKPAVWVTAAAVVVCAAAAVCLLTNPRDRTPYGWASRVTAGGLNVTYLCEGNSARTPAGMSGLTSRLAEQLNGLTEEDFPLLENYAYNIFDQGREPFRLQMGRKAGKRELLYGGDSGYPLMLLYRGKLYGVDSEELLQTILEYTRGVQVVPAGTELALRMGLSVPVYVAVGVLAYARERQRAVPIPAYAKALLIGVIGYWFSSYADFKGLETLTPQFERLILFTYPLFVLLLGAALFHMPLRWKPLVAFGIAYLGLAVVFLADFKTGPVLDCE